jgi:hypothetical protein
MQAGGDADKCNLSIDIYASFLIYTLSKELFTANYFSQWECVYGVISASDARGMLSNISMKIQQITPHSNHQQVEKLKKIADFIMLRINGEKQELLLLMLANSLENSG